MASSRRGHQSRHHLSLYEAIDQFVTVGLYKHDMGCMCLMKLEATPNLSLRAQQHDTKLHNLMYLSCIYLTYTYTYTQSHIHTPTDSYVYHYTVCMSLRAQTNTFNIPWVRGCIMTSHGGLLCRHRPQLCAWEVCQ